MYIENDITIIRYTLLLRKHTWHCSSMWEHAAIHLTVPNIHLYLFQIRATPIKCITVRIAFELVGKRL